MMTGRNFVSRTLLTAVFFGMLTPLAALGGSAAVGTIAGSREATMGGDVVQPNTVVFSGDTLRVADGAAVVAMNTGSRLVLGRRTAASFLKGSDEVVVLVEQGNVSIYHPVLAEPLRLRLGGLSVGPMKGFNTRGDLAMLDGMALVVAKEGVLRLERNGWAAEIRTGHTIAVPTKTAREPQGAPSAGAGAPPQHGGSSGVMQWAALGVGATGTILGAVGISHANNANSTARAAISAATSATSAAAAATSAAVAAGAAAQAADSAAIAAALIAESAANTVGCDLNRFANSQGEPSPYTPFKGFTCP
jgi:hypothetical protein